MKTHRHPQPGHLGFWIDPSGKPAAAVVTKIRLIETIERSWRLDKIGKHRWQLSFWWRRNKGPWKPHEDAIIFSEKDEATARAKAKAEAERIFGELAGGKGPGAFDAVPTNERERWIDSWIHAHKKEWPNLFSLPKGKQDEADIKGAMAADLIAMGFMEPACKAVCRLALKTTIGQADKLNVFLVTNWFHGAQLAKKSPSDQLKAAKSAGFKHATVDMIKKRASRLALTHRLSRQ